MDLDYTCVGSAMHQPVDWDFTDLCPDIFASLKNLNHEPQPQQQLQQLQTATATLTSIAPTGTPTYVNSHSTWASPMHQPVDWELPSLQLLLAASTPVAVQDLPQQVPHITLQQQQQQQSLLPVSASSPGHQHSKQQQAAAASYVPPCRGLPQLQKDNGDMSGATVGTKRDRSVRCTKSSALRPQQQQMLELRKKLDALHAEHAVVEAENERLKTRLRVLEAVLPVRQQQALLAQSKAAVAAPSPLPTNPVLASLMDLATSGPSSCATSTSRLEPTTIRPIAATAFGTCATCCCGDAASANATSDRRFAAEDPAGPAAVTTTYADVLAVCSPAQAIAAGEPTPCASSSCGTSIPHPMTSGYTTKCNVQLIRNNQNNCNNTDNNNQNNHSGRNGHNGLMRSFSIPISKARHYLHHHHRHHHSDDCPHRNDHSLPHGHVGGSEQQVDSHERWIDAWRAWVREAALLLQAYDARPSEHYLNRLDEAFESLKAEVVHLDLRHPELICNMRCVNLETGVEQEFPPDSFWAPVVASMKLDAQQLANCNSALALYRERMAVVLMERRSLAAQMSSCLTALQLEEAQGRVATGSSRREQLTLEAEEAASALDANVAAEGHTMSLARDLLGSKLFSRLQIARASVLSYPYFADALALLTAAVGEHDVPPQAPGQQQQQQHQ